VILNSTAVQKGFYMANHLIGRIESLVSKFEYLYDLITTAFFVDDGPAPKPKSPYQYGFKTEYYIKRVDAGDSCLKELLDLKRWHEEGRARLGYPIDKSYHAPLCEAIEVLQRRQPVTVEQLHNFGHENVQEERAQEEVTTTAQPGAKYPLTAFDQAGVLRLTPVANPVASLAEEKS
jgi:hypothetical protein